MEKFQFKYLGLLLFFVFGAAQAQLQTQVQITGNLPKGYLIWTFDDGPDEYVYSLFAPPANQTLDIAALLADPVANQTGQKIVGWFFQNPCHYSGADNPNPVSSNCATPHYGNIPWTLLDQILALGHGIGNHGQNHVPALVTSPTGQVTDLLSDSGIVYEFARAQASLASHQPSLRLYRPAGFTWTPHIAHVLNSHRSTRGFTGPFYADFLGAGIINGQTVAADWDCFRQGFGYQECGDLFLKAIREANHGGIILVHDRSPYMVGSHNVFLMVKYMLSQLAAQKFLSLQSTLTGRKAGAIIRQTAEFGAGDGFGDIVAGRIAGGYQSALCKSRSDGIWCTVYGEQGFAPATRWFTFQNRSRQNRGRDSLLPGQKFWLADLEGSGKAGLVWEEGAGIMFAPSLYEPAAAPGLFGSPRLVLACSADTYGWRNSPNYTLLFGRFDRSGRHSLLVRDASGIRIFLSNGISLDPPTAVLTSAQFSDSQGWADPQYSVRAGDIDGDGLDDVCGRGQRAIFCSLVTASGIGAAAPWTAMDGPFSNAQGWGDDPNAYGSFVLSDLFGQGKQVPAGRIGSQVLFTNPGFSGSRQLVDSLPAEWRTSPVYFADIDGDGQEEAIWMLPTGLYAGLTQIVLEVP